MKKKVLSLGLCVAMTAALMPTVMVQATGTEFPEYLYVSDFTDGMDKFEIVGNSTYNVASDADGNLVITPTVAQWSNNGTIYLTGSEDWEEYKLEADIQLLGTKQNYLMLAPNHAKEAVKDSDSGFLVFDNGEMFRHDAGGLQIKSWHHQTLKYTVNVNGLDVSANVRYPGETDDVAQALVSKIPFTQRGGFAIRTMWSSGDTIIKSVKVTDLRAKAIADNTTGLSTGDKVSVKFSESMNTADFVPGNVYLEKDGEKVDVVAVEANSDAEMLVTIPGGLLKNAEYNLVVKKEITDADGDRLNNDKVFAITTAKDALSLLSSTPANGSENVKVDMENIKLGFDAVGDFNNAIVTLKDSDGNEADISFDTESSDELTISINEILSFENQYTLTVSGVKNAESGASCDNFVVKFTTEKADDSLEYLYISDFTSGMDKLEEVTNSGYTFTNENGHLVCVTPGTSGDGLSLFLNGSEDWLKYELVMEAQLLGTGANYLFIYPNHDKTPGTNSGPGYLVYNNGGRQFVIGKEKLDSWSQVPLTYTFNVNGKDVDATVSYRGESKVMPLSGEYTQAGGGFVIRAVWATGNTVINSIKVKDLAAKAYAFNTENLVPGDRITVKFSEAMDFDSITAETVYIDDNGYKIPVTMTNDGTDDLYITIPEDILANNTYTLVIEKEVTNLAGERLNGDKKFPITTAASNINVVSSKPANGEENVNLLTDVSVTFDNAIDLTKLDEAIIELEDSIGNAVECTVSIEKSTNKTICLSIDEDLNAGETYTAVVSNVYSADGYKMIGKKRIQFTTAEDSEFIYFNDFSDPNTISDFSATLGTGGSVTIEDGRLYIKTNNETTKLDANVDTYATLKNSAKWSDYEVEFDLQAHHDTRYITFGVRDSANVLIADFNTKSEYHVGDEIFYRSGYGDESTDFVPANPSKMIGKNTSHKVNVKVIGNQFTLTVDDEVVYDKARETMNKLGAIRFGARYIGSISIDNLKVKDYSIGYKVTNKKDVKEGDEVLVTFDTEMNQDTFDTEFVTMYDADGVVVNAQVRAVDSKTMAIKVPYGVMPNTIYYVKMSTDIISAAGVPLANEKVFEIRTAEKEFSVSDLILKVDGVEPASVKSGDVVTVSAYAKNNSVEKQNAVLIIAVYDDDRLIEVKFTPISLEGKTDDTFYISDYTIPQGENITASVMVWDGLKTVKPLAKNKLY